jgi:hypothetical protein
MREKKAKSWERNTRRTLVVAASDTGLASDVVSAEARANEVVTGASDGVALDAR